VKGDPKMTGVSLRSEGRCTVCVGDGTDGEGTTGDPVAREGPVSPSSAAAHNLLSGIEGARVYSLAATPAAGLAENSAAGLGAAPGPAKRRNRKDFDVSIAAGTGGVDARRKGVATRGNQHRKSRSELVCDNR
jgi:hypothetical protein